MYEYRYNVLFHAFNSKTYLITLLSEKTSKNKKVLAKIHQKSIYYFRTTLKNTQLL